jgi:hypothetical protein
MPDWVRGTFERAVGGIVCVLLALFTLVLILELYVRRAAVCLTTTECHVMGIAGAALGIVGLVVLFGAVATPSRR